MKKGQIEVVGLVIIVILLILLVFMFFKLKMSDDNQISDERLGYQTSSILTTLLKITTLKGDFQDLVTRCSSGDCNDLDSEIINIMDAINGEIKREYSFEFEDADGLFHSVKNCSKKIPAFNKFKKNGKVYTVWFWFC